MRGDPPRPRIRADCIGGVRPCPYVSCKHHIYLDVNPNTGALKINFPGVDVTTMERTCSLDIADEKGRTLKEVGDILGLTRERIRQLEVKALLHVRLEMLRATK